MTQPLGPFQEIWDAWNDVHFEITQQSMDDFRRVVELQIAELDDHLAGGDRHRAALEAIDLISVALTILRWLDLQPREIADLARQRARDRMQGQVTEILKKYRMGELT